MESMNKEAIEMLNKFITEHELFNIKQADNLEGNIKIVLNLIDKLQKENAELKENNLSYQEELAKAWKENEYLKEREEYLEKRRSDIINTFQNEVTATTIPKDKIREYCKKELAFKNRLEREKQEISEYNKGRFDTYQNIIEELLGDE